MKTAFTLKGLTVSVAAEVQVKMDELHIEFECEAGEYKEVVALVKDMIVTLKEEV